MSDKNKILKFLIQVIGSGLVFGFPLFFTWKEGNPMTWVKFLGYRKAAEAGGAPRAVAAHCAAGRAGREARLRTARVPGAPEDAP